MKKNCNSQKGFTLTELIVVILLLGIVATYAASKYSSPSDFSAYAAQEQAISVIRQIQLGRMQSNLSSATPARYKLKISDNCLGSSEAVDEYKCESGIRSNYVLVEDQTFLFTPATLEMEFDLLGLPTCISGCTTPTAGGNITIGISNGVESTQVCINSEGFVYGC
ncbi:type II secretion system protein [Vibrio nigripulchritudo]|uniref:type II secretion system protein n=1 Tax=Vibrio nigripulchritudo TaxID=28173 RepID=UPI002490F26D|nr:type II secretion system protein [Vibrio nigripulchritudo]BDU41657.1 MSHA pilin protein MshC [Vibrio nigripulchritudo]